MGLLIFFVFVPPAWCVLQYAVADSQDDQYAIHKRDSFGQFFSKKMFLGRFLGNHKTSATHHYDKYI